MDKIIQTTSAKIPVKIGDFYLGEGKLTDDLAKLSRFETPLHQVFEAIYAELKNISAVLQLATEATHAQIEQAYGKDVKMIQQRVNEFEDMIKRMIYCGIKLWQLEHQPNHSLDEKRKNAILEFLWKRLQHDIPQAQLMARAPLWITAEEHVMASKELISLLKERVQQGLLRQVKVWNSYFNTLVEKDVLGIVEWTGNTVCKYHYFTHEDMSELLTVKKFEESNGGWTKGFEQEVHKYDYFHVRVEHHLTNARAFTIKEFPQTMPEFAKEFLDKTPVWIKQYLRIIGGRLTMERVCHTHLGSEVVVDEPRMVYMNDPAIAFGNIFTLSLGWVEEGYDSYANGQDKKIQQRNDTIRRIAIVAILLVLAIWGIVVLASNYNKKVNAEERAAYTAYINAYKNVPHYTVNVGQVLYLPKPFDKMGWILGEVNFNSQYAGHRINIQLSDATGSYISTGIGIESTTNGGIDIYCEPLEQYYGDVNISNITFNVQDTTTKLWNYWRDFSSANDITMHLLKVSKKSITYALTVTPKTKK